jgi:hypothetical protein
MSTVNEQLIPDLWPKEIVFAPVLPPLAVLKHQAALLGEKSNGFLSAVVSSNSKGNMQRHELTLVVPSLDGYARPLLAITQEEGFAYPCTVHSDALGAGFDRCDTPDMLLNTLARVFASGKTRSLIFSLLARISEKVASFESSESRETTRSNETEK